MLLIRIQIHRIQYSDTSDPDSDTSDSDSDTSDPGLAISDPAAKINRFRIRPDKNDNFIFSRYFLFLIITALANNSEKKILWIRFFRIRVVRHNPDPTRLNNLFRIWILQKITGSDLFTRIRIQPKYPDPDLTKILGSGSDLNTRIRIRNYGIEQQSQGSRKTCENDFTFLLRVTKKTRYFHDVYYGKSQKKFYIIMFLYQNP